MKLTQVNLDNMEEYWIKTRSMIVDACKHSCGKYQAMDVFHDLMTGKMVLWVVEENGVENITIAEIVSFPRRKICKLICSAGVDRNKWLPLLHKVEEWAKEQGCTWMEPECRKGWARVLKPLGYAEGHILLGKAL